MKNENVMVALIVAAAFVIAAFTVSGGLRAFGRSIEKAAASIGQGMAAQRPASFPSSVRLDLGEIKIGNGGGGGESFRIQTTSK